MASTCYAGPSFTRKPRWRKRRRKRHKTDLVIGGAGFAGLALAIALRQGLGEAFAVTVVDPALGARKSKDPRASAIAAAARRLFEAIEVWDAVAPTRSRSSTWW